MTESSFNLAVFELADTVGMLVRMMRMAGASRELSWSEAAVLKRLAVEGPRTTAELARAQGMQPQSMGSIIGTLEELRMVERTPHETDRRQTTISLTDKGMETQRLVTEAKRSWLARSIAGLGEKEQATVFEAGRILRDMLDPGGKRAEV